MNPRLLAPVALVLACFGSAIAATPPASKATPPKGKMFIDGKLDTGQFLPDTTVICRVGSRVTTVGDFVRGYFNSYAEDRPLGDSAGRVTFLNNIIVKDILGQVAREVAPAFTFEDRVVMREYTQRMLSNILYQRAVTDSLDITEEDLLREYEIFRHEVRMRHIQFADLATAERVRRDLLRGRITWQQAYDRYSLSKGRDKGPDGELGWATRAGTDLTTARKVFSLGAGGISEVIEAADGYNIAQVIEKREGTPPSFDAVRSNIRDQMTSERTGARSAVIRDLVRAQIAMTYDSTAIAWAAGHFPESFSTAQGAGGRPELNFNTTLPEFAPGDTARVLARFRGGVYTLGRFMSDYASIQPLLRPSVNTLDRLMHQLDSFAFEPYMAQVAISRGLDKDPLVVERIEAKREELMVQHLYQDSVLSRVFVSSKARRKYYEEHMAGYITFARVRFAAMWAKDAAEADTFAARLRAGEKAEDMIRADALLGIERGSIQERMENEHGLGQKLLFQDLRPGQVAIEGPDRQGRYAVLQSLEFIPGRQLSFEESEGMIDESLQNIESERTLHAFVDRHRKRFKVEARPDLVMRIRLVDPTL